MLLFVIRQLTQWSPFWRPESPRHPIFSITDHILLRSTHFVEGLRSVPSPSRLPLLTKLVLLELKLSTWGRCNSIFCVLVTLPPHFWLVESHVKTECQTRADDSGRIRGAKQVFSLCSPYWSCLVCAIRALFCHLFGATNLNRCIVGTLSHQGGGGGEFEQTTTSGQTSPQWLNIEISTKIALMCCQLVFIYLIKTILLGRHHDFVRQSDKTP